MSNNATVKHSSENPFESMMSRFDEAARIIGLDEGSYNVLKSPEKKNKKYRE